MPQPTLETAMVRKQPPRTMTNKKPIWQFFYFITGRVRLGWGSADFFVSLFFSLYARITVNSCVIQGWDHAHTTSSTHTKLGHDQTTYWLPCRPPHQRSNQWPLFLDWEYGSISLGQLLKQKTASLLFKFIWLFLVICAIWQLSVFHVQPVSHLWKPKKSVKYTDHPPCVEYTKNKCIPMVVAI